MALVEAIFVVSGTVVVVASCAGLIIVPDAFVKLHFTGPASIIGSALLAAGIVAGEGAASMSAKAVAIFVLLAAAAPVTSHAIARAARIRRVGFWEPHDEEIQLDQIVFPEHVDDRAEDS